MGEWRKSHFAKVDFNMKSTFNMDPVDEKGHRINTGGKERTWEDLKPNLPISQHCSKLGLPHALWVRYRYV